MAIPKRQQEQAGRWALVDGIPFQMPVQCKNSPALFAVFPINAEKAQKLIPGNEIRPFRLRDKGLLVITVIDYLNTTIGKYIEFSIAIACVHRDSPAPSMLPDLLTRTFDIGQWVVDLPVSSEVSVKGGKGIWGMPKHQANLDYKITDTTISSQYDLDGQLAMKIEIDRPDSAWVPMSMAASNYAAFRGMLMKSNVNFTGKMGFHLGKKGSARLTLGDHPRMQPLKGLEIEPDPIATAFIPEANGVLDDHFECWFLTFDELPKVVPEGMESVIDLGQSQAWLAPPKPLAD